MTFEEYEKMEQKRARKAAKKAAKESSTPPPSSPPPSSMPSAGSGQLMNQNGYYYFATNFTTDSTKPVITWIMENNLLPDSKRPDYLTLVINSPGGNVHACFALIDAMKTSAIPVRTMGLGLIASCGILTFMAGEKGHRTITQNTSIMSHQYSWGSVGKEHELFGRMREYELSSERMINHYKKCTGLSESKIRKFLLPETDVWLSSEEAVEYGIADKIVETY